MLRGVSAAGAARTLPSAEAVAGIDAVDRDAWDALAGPGQGPARHGYIAAWSHAELPCLQTRPLVAREGGELLAASNAYLYELDLAVVHTPFLARAVALVRRLFPRLLKTRVFEIGSSTPLVPPFLCADDVDPAAGADAILRAGLEEASRRGASMVIVQNFESPRDATSGALRRHGFGPVPIPPTAVVQLPFSSFDEYLGAMRSQYRRRARKTIEASEHLRVEHVEDFSELVPELARLWRLVFDRADEVKRELLPEAYFGAVAELDDVSALLLRREDGSIASYALMLDDRPWLHFLFTGFEEPAGREENAYFRLLYELVRHGIEHGFDAVNLGMTTLAPKMDVGGVPTPVWAWMRHRRPRLQRLFIALGSGPLAPHVPEPRNVFKG